MRSLNGKGAKGGVLCLALAGLVAGGAAMFNSATAADPPRVAKTTTGRTGDTPLAPAIGVAQSSLETLANVKDYQATFQKAEWIDGQVLTQTMRIKLREEPFSVYLLFGGPNEGREVIYVDGKNDGNMLVHETGIKSIVGTLALKPDSPRVMQENRYPITMIGIRHMLQKVIEQWQSEAQISGIDVKYFPNAKLGDREMKVVQTTHPRPQAGVKFHMTRLYIDKETNLPARVEQFGFPKADGQRPPLLEDYIYTNIQVGVGLKDVDFDTKNPRYNF